ncbi:MAG: hypothetical protein CL608_25710 [Anaerolineaceae bacterium]|nr:hypothetical protein [Anaerolineaceae bacterium]
MSKLVIHTLGPLTIELDGRSLTNVLSRKAQLLLVYLACQPHPVSREVLTTFFWQDSTAEQGLTNLRKTLSELRRRLQDHLVTERQLVGLNDQHELWLDIAELPRLLHIETATEETRAAAVSLYHGPFLAELTLPDNPEFMAWVALQHEQSRQLIINALHFLAKSALQKRDYEGGIAYAQQLVTLEPLSEVASRTLMLLLARAGQIQAALAEYARCRQQLADELGVAPTPKTQTLADRIATAETKLPALPFTEADFIGREAELNQINQHLANPNGRWLTITGPGGVGKSWLALQAVREWAYDFLHGVYLVSLTAVDSPTTFTSTLVAALDVPLSGPEPPQQQLLNFLRHKEMLLLLDDAENLLAPAMADTADLLLAILQQAPQVRLIVTSRERFNYQMEQLLMLSGLPLTKTAALKLFLNRAAQVRPDFVPDSAMLASIRHICQLVDGLPLGIELAAAGLATHSPQQIATEIGQTLDFLRREASQEVSAERHSSLRAVFSSAWQQLPAAEQGAFARLSLFPGSFTAAAAGAVANASTMVLLSLLDKSMLKLVEDRYQLHPLLRQFAAEMLTEATAVQAQFGRYYARFLQQQGSLLGGNREQQALKAIEVEIDNIRAAWHWLLAHGSAAEIDQAVVPLHRFYDVRGWFLEGEDSFREAVAQWQRRTETADFQPLLARLLARLGFFQERLSLIDTAVETLQKSLAILQQHAMPSEEALVLNHLGLAVYTQGAYQQAEEYYRHSLTVSRQAQVHEMQAKTLVNLAVLLREQGAYQAARQLLDESLLLLRRSGDQRQMSIALQVQGRLDEAEGAFVEAQAHYRQSLAICEQINDRLGRAIVCSSLVNLARLQNELPEAQVWAQQALTLFEEIGDPWGMAISSVRLGELALDLADYAQAQQLFEASLVLTQEMGDQRGTAVSLCNLGYVALALNLLPKARKQLGKAVEIAADIQFLPILLKAFAGLAELLSQTSELAEAAALAAFVQHHPAADGSIRKLAGSTFQGLSDQLTPEQMAAAQAKGETWEVTAVVAWFQTLKA